MEKGKLSIEIKRKYKSQMYDVLVNSSLKKQDCSFDEAIKYVNSLESRCSTKDSK